ncbi:hypothetical protein FGB62_58g034 [Gracilaria domingensis]|nr:hypothetical protein FGB62_58g034 [Gracilaria domingensis]
MLQPWSPQVLEEELETLTHTVTNSRSTKLESVETVRSAADFHLRFLRHHLRHTLFPSENATENPQAAFASDPSRRYLPFLIASAVPRHSPTKSSKNGPLLHSTPTLQPGGKPVFNQSALHGFHVFEGLQIVGERAPDSVGFRLGYTFLRDKISKLVDGIIRLRFAVHFLKAQVLTEHLCNAGDNDARSSRDELTRLLTVDLRLRRKQAEQFVSYALFNFISANREEIEATLASDPNSGFYVRIEAQGGNRESIGQGPIGVGQSTLQVLGQHARRGNVCTQLVFNLGGPPRMHTLAGPYVGTPYHELLNNAAVHHGNMGHQHLSSELAQPHGAQMLMTSAEIDDEGRLLGPFIAETNFSNVGLVFEGGRVVFPKSTSATYGLTQHVVRTALREALDAGEKLDGVTSVEHDVVAVDDFMKNLREGKLLSAFVLGSMPGVERVDKLFVDETLVGGTITVYDFDAESLTLKTLQRLYASAYQRSIVWEQSVEDMHQHGETE